MASSSANVLSKKRTPYTVVVVVEETDVVVELTEVVVEEIVVVVVLSTHVPHSKGQSCRVST
jgi:hypothetical protein